MHDLVAYVKEELPFSRNLPLGKTADSFVFDLLYFTQCLTSLSSINRTFFVFMAWLLLLFHLRKVSNDLTQMVSIPTRILIVQLFWICFLLLMLVFLLQWLSLHWEILIMLSQFPFTFHQINIDVPRFIAQHMTILVLIVMVFVII